MYRLIGCVLSQREVMVHVTIVKVGEVNTTRECFDAEVLIRSRWREPQLDHSIHVCIQSYTETELLSSS